MSSLVCSLIIELTIKRNVFHRFDDALARHACCRRHSSLSKQHFKRWIFIAECVIFSKRRLEKNLRKKTKWFSFPHCSLRWMTLGIFFGNSLISGVETVARGVSPQQLSFREFWNSQRISKQTFLRCEPKWKHCRQCWARAQLSNDFLMSNRWLPTDLSTFLREANFQGGLPNLHTLCWLCFVVHRARAIWCRPQVSYDCQREWSHIQH